MNNIMFPEAYKHLQNYWIFHRKSLLTIGFFLMIISNMPGGAGVFAWFMLAPFLVYVTLYHGAKNDLWLLLSLLAGSILTLMKAVSVPFTVSIAISIMLGTVIGLRYCIAFLAWRYIRKRTGDFISIMAFPSIIVTLEYFQAFYTPFGDWGALANTQLYNIPLLQTSSLFGFTGISALIAWAAVLLASVLLTGSLADKGKYIAVFLTVFIALNVYGDLRLDTVPPGKQILAAAIMSQGKFTGIVPNPDDPEVIVITENLIEQTRKAANRGAVIAVWGEASIVLTKKGEASLLATLSQLAKTDNISIVAAYIVLPENWKNGYSHFENKFTWIQNNGEIAETYLKHHPVPGSPSERGTAPLKVVHTENGNMAGAICYDYDFPQMALTQARLGAEMIVLPGMDWRGMLRRHTLMSRIRAIEGGFSLLRAANGATSMGFDNYGQIRAAMPAFGNNDKILLASLPVERINTLYSRIGNTLAYIAVLGLLFSFFVARRNHARTVKIFKK
jgi:apolipoprotein N-acyltransferase